MCREPATRAPRSGCFGPNSARVAINPGISVSAIAISLRPQSARPMSFTTQSFTVVVIGILQITAGERELPVVAGLAKGGSGVSIRYLIVASVLPYPPTTRGHGECARRNGSAAFAHPTAPL